MDEDVIGAFTEQRDEDGVLYTREGMIRCDLALNLNGMSGDRQFSPESLTNIKEYPSNFNSQPDSTEHDLEGEEPGSEYEA